MFTLRKVATGHRYTRTGVLLALAVGLVLAAQVAVADDCNGIRREIVFAGLNWPSAQLQNHIAGQILQAGFGCEYTDIPGSTIPMVQGLVRGDIDINMEIWFNTAPEMYFEAADAGDVLDLGMSMDGAGEFSFLVPRYVIEGDAERGIKAMAPDLKSITDLPRYAEVFQDPEEPDKGRYYNCVIGWQCELVNNDKMATYGLDEHFTNFKPGTGAALAASLVGAYEKGEPWLGYYWSPTWVLGKYDMVVLEEPAYSDDCWVDGDRGCAFPTSVLHVALSKEFSEMASGDIVDFLDAYAITLRQLAPYLQMMSNDVDAIDAATGFLKEEADVWTAWVSDDVAARVKAALN